ncbi:helix-turn-helix domain-containing protein [Priestia aryabhattai]
MAEEIINQFEGHIYKNSSRTKPEEREDLAQEIRLKIVEKVFSNKFDETPGFFDVLLNDDYY